MKLSMKLPEFSLSFFHSFCDLFQTMTVVVDTADGTIHQIFLFQVLLILKKHFLNYIKTHCFTQSKALNAIQNV